MGLGRSLLFPILALFSLTACGPSGSTTSSVSAFKVNESDYCPATTDYSGTTVNIVARGEYYRYDDTLSGLTSISLNRIRHAEVIIQDSSGKTIQCGETDNDGDIGAVNDYVNGIHTNKFLKIPRLAGTYKIYILSRGNNFFVKASVLNNPTQALPYGVVRQFSLIGNETSVSVSPSPASANGTYLGGAFHIFDQILNANQFLRNNTGCSFCTTFSVAPKIQAFWTPGFNPGSYINMPSSGVSFYNKYDTPGLPRGLFILGGTGGNICGDTDHYDKSVILHEYGHFLESTYSISNSPGGPHAADDLIDPRLAWSEGWANFIQGPMLGRSYYIDTYGSADCSNASLTVLASLTNQDIAVPVRSGEGNFRELATSRALYNTHTQYNFSSTWHTFTHISFGMSNPNLHFRNPSGFFQLFYNVLTNPTMNNLSGASLNTYNSVMSSEKMGNNSQRFYAYPVSPRTENCSSDPSFQFAAGTPVAPPAPNTPPIPETSLPYSNKFFQFYHDGSNEFSSLTLNFNSIDSSPPYNLNLIVYKENHSLNSDWEEDNGPFYTNDLAAYSMNSHSRTSLSGSEVISMSNKPSGYYLIKVRAKYEGENRQTTLFQITTSTGKYLCP